MEELQLELTTACNSNCIMCPRLRLKRPSGTMSERNAYEIIDECIKSGLETIKLQWFGESLLVSYWYKIARYAKKKGIKVILFTNGSLLNKKNREKVLRFVDKIFISIDSHIEKEYENIRVGLKYREVISNLKKLYEERGDSKTKIIISAVRDNKDKDFIDFFSQYSDEVIINKDCIIDWDGKKRNVICKHNFSNRMVVSWNKKCYLCCHDWLGEYQIGDLNEETIKEIEEKKKHIKLNDLDICQKCAQLSEQLEKEA